MTRKVNVPTFYDVISVVVIPFVRAQPGRQSWLVLFFTVAFLIGVPSSLLAGSPSPDPSALHGPQPVFAALSETMPEFTASEPAAMTPRLQKATTQIIASISFNTEPKGDYFLELDEVGGLYLKVEDILALKLGFDQGRLVLIHNDKYAPMNALRDVVYTFDEKKLAISILGKTTEKRLTSIDVFPAQIKPQNVYYPRETSAFVNYGLNYAYTDPFGFQSFSASNKVGARTGDIFFVSDSLYTESPTDKRFVRLATNATYERRGDLQWIVLGDQVASPGNLGSSLNIGGIGFSKVYKLDPYFITQPVQSIKGVTPFPTQAEIYMDGVLLGKHSVAPGSFELQNIYSYGGAHTIEVLLTDPFGNGQRITYPMYFSADLLREGNHEYSYNAGFLREQFGTRSNEYGRPAFSAFHRYGATGSLTVGARIEGSDSVYNGGISSSFTVPWVGGFTLLLAGSSADGQTGTAGSFRHSYQLGSFNTNLQLVGFSRSYATVSIPASTESTKYQASLAIGFLIPPVGGFSLGFSESETYGGINTRVTSASYSRGLTRTTSIFATASATRILDTTYNFFVGLNFTPANNMHGVAQYNRFDGTDTETVQIQKDTPIGEGLGYRAFLNRVNAQGSSSSSFNPSLQYNAKYGIYSMDANVLNSSGSTRESYNVSAAGSVVYAGGFFGISRPVNDSFGIIMVDEVAGAMVLNNGQEIGQTGSSGTLIVPSLTSYNDNLIALDLKNLPMDYSLAGVNARLSPSLWSGSCVAFDAVKVRAVTGSLSMKGDDKKMPAEFVDIIMKVGEREVTSPTGKGGEFYIENIFPAEPITDGTDKQSCRAIAERKKTGGDYIHPGIYSAWVDVEGGKCRFSIFFPETEDVITDLGEVECLMSGK